ncbi:hypothetical protein PR048_031358 [Dryococelus australis]|uniref:Uncharacterized protein n=1 Tax=Dryococelus australis TaxID=614101 RepID=A0ABQ9G944_9NEOP|nr:hypothetical protein PR048_031358 [Dryococelus australis]
MPQQHPRQRNSSLQLRDLEFVATLSFVALPIVLLRCAPRLMWRDDLVARRPEERFAKVTAQRFDTNHSQFIQKDGRGSDVVRSLASRMGEAGSNPRRGHFRIFARGDRAGRCCCSDKVYSGISRFSRPLHSDAAPYSHHFTLIGSQDLDVNSRPKPSPLPPFRREMTPLYDSIQCTNSTDSSAVEDSEVLHGCQIMPLYLQHHQHLVVTYRVELMRIIFVAALGTSSSQLQMLTCQQLAIVSATTCSIQKSVVTVRHERTAKLLLASRESVLGVSEPASWLASSVAGFSSRGENLHQGRGTQLRGGTGACRLLGHLTAALPAFLQTPAGPTSSSRVFAVALTHELPTGFSVKLLRDRANLGQAPAYVFKRGKEIVPQDKQQHVGMPFASRSPGNLARQPAAKRIRKIPQLAVANQKQGPFLEPRSSSLTKANRVRFTAWVTPGFSHMGIVMDDATDRWVFSGISRFPALSFRHRPILTSLHPHRLSRPRCWELPKFLHSRQRNRELTIANYSLNSRFAEVESAKHSPIAQDLITNLESRSKNEMWERQPASC